MIRVGMRNSVFGALLGAVSGVVAAGLIWLYLQYLGEPVLFHPPFFELPGLVLSGLIYGVAASVGLRRLGLAEWWQAAALTAISILSWSGGGSLTGGWAYDYSYFSNGFVWGCIQAGGTVAIFPFARRRVLWFALPVAGGLIVSLAEIFEAGYYFLYWPALYATHAAFLSMVLPVGEGARGSARTTPCRPRDRRPENHPIMRLPVWSGFGGSLPWRWVGLGALSGALACGLTELMISAAAVCLWFIYPHILTADLHSGYFPRMHLISPTLLSPGLAYGAVAGIALWRQGLTQKWQVAALIGVSILASGSGYLILGFINPAPLAAQTIGFIDLGITRPAIDVAWPFLFGGLIWGAIQTAGTAAIFPFARLPRLWFVLIIAGGFTAWLAAEAFLFFVIRDNMLAAIWIAWYAVHTAILFSVLPTAKD